MSTADSGDLHMSEGQNADTRYAAGSPRVVTWWQKGQQQPGWHYLCRDCGLTGYSAEPSPEAHMAWCSHTGREGDQ